LTYPIWTWYCPRATDIDIGRDQAQPSIGYVKPEFNEIYTFKILVNDAARLWLDGKILFDYFNVDIDAKLQSVLYEGVTIEPLVAEKLLDIKIEFRENTGSALIHLLWESKSQALSTIPSNRLFSSSESLRGSPFMITTIGFKPSPPNGLTLKSADWDKLLVSWTPPVEDGGEEVVAYLIEYWENDGESFGKTAKQMLRLSKEFLVGRLYYLLEQKLVQRLFISMPLHLTLR
jgi:hypothetical protein